MEGDRDDRRLLRGGTGGRRQDAGYVRRTVSGSTERQDNTLILAREHPTRAGESLLGAYATLAALVDTARREERLERGDDVAGSAA